MADLLRKLGRSVDRLFEAVAPGAALKRRAAREMLAAGRLESEHSNFTYPVDVENHPDNDLIPDSAKQRRRCTLSYINNALVRGIVDSEVRQVIRSFKVNASTGSDRTDQKIKDAWKALREETPIMETIKSACRHMLIDGGILPVPVSNTANANPAHLTIRLFPYRQVQSPLENSSTTKNIRDGFYFDTQGNPIAFYVQTEEASFESVMPTGKHRQIPLWTHLCSPRLVGQTKGLSWYSAAMTRLEMVNRWMMSLLRSAELHANVVALVNSGSSTIGGMATKLPHTTEMSEGFQKRVMKWADQHRILFLPQGANYQLIQAHAPQIAEFLIWNLRFIARALGVSYERLTYDLTKTSFSSTKFGDRDDVITVREHQDTLRQNLLCPINRRLIENLFLTPGNGLSSSQYLKDPDAFCRMITFTLPGRPPVDDLKAANASKTNIEQRIASRTALTADLGGEVEQVEDELVAEEKRWIQKQKEMFIALGLPEDEALRAAIGDRLIQANNQDPRPGDAATPNDRAAFEDEPEIVEEEVETAADEDSRTAA